MTTTRLGHAARLTTGVALVVLALSVPASAQPAEGSIVGLRLTGVVDPFISDYLQNGIADATEAGAPAVLIEIDTPGGLVSETREITQAILNAGVPVLCYVSPSGARAASAGSFVLMSCHVAAMAPGTNVGAATPVGLDGAVGSQKAVNDAAASIKSIAEERDRNAEVAESFVTDAVSISAEQALADDVIDLIATTERALLDEVDGTSVTLGDGTTEILRTADVPVEDRSLGGFIGFLHGLLDPSLAFLFFWLGIVLIVLELLVPGHIFSGTVGTILLVLSIVSFGLLPVQLIGILLLVAAAVLLIVELNAPGLGVFGILGLAALVLGGWFLYDRAGGASVSPVAIVLTAAVVGVFFAFVVAKVMSVRRQPIVQGPETMIGRTGVAIGSGLEPRGIVRVTSEEWRALAAGDTTIPPGTAIRVTGIDGLVLTVERDDEHRVATGGNPVDEERNV